MKKFHTSPPTASTSCSARAVATAIGLMRDGRLLRTLRAADVPSLERDHLYLEEIALAAKSAPIV